MKEVRFTVTDHEHRMLTEVKGGRTWREAVFDAFNVERQE